jgi:hypothetical protein
MVSPQSNIPPPKAFLKEISSSIKIFIASIKAEAKAKKNKVLSRCSGILLCLK